MTSLQTDALSTYAPRGVLFLSVPPGRGALDLSDWRWQLGTDTVVCGLGNQTQVVSWNLDLDLNRRLMAATILPLSLGARDGTHDLDAMEIGAQLSRNQPTSVNDMLPPFAAARIESDRVLANVDGLGFRHLYAAEGDGWTGISTSSRALGLLAGAELDSAAVATQGLLGWQVGLRSMFNDVSKIAPGGSVEVSGGRLSHLSGSEPERPIEHAHHEWREEYLVGAAAAFLRTYVGEYVEDHPDMVLQLTGGLDSRILLAALPPSRRRGLEVMTLRVPDNEDADIAAGLAERYGMTHRQIDFNGIAALDPAEAFRLCLTSARRLDSAADPIALAAVDFAELSMDARPRIAGLGGEVARGFYYFGPKLPYRVTRARVSRLANWRMFSNESAPIQMFTADFGLWARQSAVDDVFNAFTKTDQDWFTATDNFYLHQRLHRWAGVLASATALERVIVNPMLHPQFLNIVAQVPPQQKRNARFLSRLLLELDPELGAIRMDGRPSPQTYAQHGLGNQFRLSRVMAGKVVGKIKQRLHHVGRPPEGGALLAEKVLEHLRCQPHLLDRVGGNGILEPAWLQRVILGQTDASPAAVALLVNLIATLPEQSEIHLR